MELQTVQPPSSPSTSYPRWVLLEPIIKIINIEDDTSGITNDAKTLATATTSTGHRIHVSLVGLLEPPATSTLGAELDPDHGGVAIGTNSPTIVSAHGDSFLIQVNLQQGYYGEHSTVDHFVYSAGAADPPRPPSLSLLPPYNLGTYGTGILRGGEDEIIVAELRMQAVSDSTRRTKAAKLSMFRSGEWEVRCPRISSSKGVELDQLPSWWSTTNSVVVPVGDRTLCWADLTCGILFCHDVLEDCPLLQYIPLPTEIACLGGAMNRNLCATAGDVLKFVNIFRRCCCGGGGVSSCQHSENAYTIQTWTLRMDVMEWVMDAMVDSTELWMLEAYKGLPRVPLNCPVVSMDEPHMISFQLCESNYVRQGNGTLWLLMVDTRSKTIQSVSRHPNWLPGLALIPSRVSYYLNSHLTCSSHHTPEGGGKICQMDINEGGGKICQMDINEKHKDNDDRRNSMMLSSCKSSVEPSVQASEILVALQEMPIYGLCRDDMLKAYSILSHGDGRRFRSLLGLPSNLRKDWLLMEIKACNP